MPILTAPFALLALLAIPALIAIYFFQRRFRTREVSSLLLWAAVRQPAIGGRTRERLRLPLTFWLELAALALLALAAAGPLIARASRMRPLVIIVDDSLSMQVGAHDRGRAFIEEEIDRRSYRPIRVVFAGATPQLAGEAATTSADVRRQLAAWTCRAPSADLDAAIALGAQAGGPTALLLVVTDHRPEQKLENGRIRWHAFGSPQPNVAFGAATRSSGERDRVLLEVASYARQPVATTLTLAQGTRVLDRRTVRVAPRSRERLTLELPPNTAAIEARLGDDEAAFDNSVVLLPERRPPVRVALRVRDAQLLDAVRHALEATGRALVTEERPQLVIADTPVTEGWALEILPGGGAAFAGPYLIDRTHPLSEGLSLDGVIWGASRGALSGDPVIVVGSQPLVSSSARSGGAQAVRIRLDLEHSNLQRSPAWPALLWNLLEWRSEHLPGLRRTNVIVGATAAVSFPANVTSATVTAPDGTSRAVEVRDGAAVIAATQPGVWKVADQAFAANVFVPGESDFSTAASGSWGKWDERVLAASGYESAAWLLLLLALAALVAHQRTTAGAMAT